MKHLFLAAILSLTSAYAYDFADHPMSPDLQMTPGKLCANPTSYRYPERIPYCERNVDSATKAWVFTNYRKKGFSLSEPRDHYKIDHFIPLCAGGSNELTNLWPQHVDVYTVTDEMEGLGCQKLSQGKIKQAALVKLIKDVKCDLSKASSALKYLYTL